MGGSMPNNAVLLIEENEVQNMPSYKTIIVDEDSSARQQLAELLNDRSDIDLIGQYSNGLEAITVINTENLDLVFLEIEMPDITGFEVLNNVEKDHFPLIVFTSLHTDYAAQAFEVEALDYIQKPFDKDRVEKSLARIKNRITNGISNQDKEQITDFLHDVRKPRRLNRFIIKQAGEYHLVRAKNIIWIESDGNYSRVITKEKKFMIRYTLSGFDEQLDSNRFYRISRSRIVNLDYVVKIKDHIYGNYMVELSNGVSLKMSKNYRQLLEALKNF